MSQEDEPDARPCDIRGGSYDTIDLGKFSGRLNQLYKHWIDKDKNASLWGNSDVLVIETSHSSKNFRSAKSSALHIWLFGVEFPNTTIIFGRKRIDYLCNWQWNDEELIKVLEVTAKVSASVLNFTKTKDKDIDAEIEQMDRIFMSVRNSVTRNRKDKTTIVGYIPEESVGSFSNWWPTIKPKDKEKMYLVDVSNGFADLICVKDTFECGNVKMSGAVSGDVMDKHVQRNLEHIIITLERKLSYSKLSNLFAKEILNQTRRLQQIKEKINGISNRSGERLSSTEKIIRYMKPEKVRICLVPDIRGGNETHVLPRSENVVSCSIGSAYGSYCSFIARTYLFNPNEYQLNAYRVLFEAQKAAIAALQPGSRIRDIYNSALAVVQKQDVHGFVRYIGNTVGTGIGIEFNETYLELNATNEVPILPGMVFKVVVSLNNMQSTDGEMLSMILGDTVIVGEIGVPPRVVTLSLKKVEEVVCRSKKESEGSSGAKDLKRGNQELQVYRRKRPRKELQGNSDE